MVFDAETAGNQKEKRRSERREGERRGDETEKGCRIVLKNRIGVAVIAKVERTAFVDDGDGGRVAGRTELVKQQGRLLPSRTCVHVSRRGKDTDFERHCPVTCHHSA